MAKNRRTVARQWVEKAKPMQSLKVGEWLEDPAAIARRLEVVGMLQWYHEKCRENRWWRRAARWILSKLTRGRWGVPVNRDPIYHLGIWMGEKYREAGLVEEDEDTGLEVVK